MGVPGTWAARHEGTLFFLPHEQPSACLSYHGTWRGYSMPLWPAILPSGSGSCYIYLCFSQNNTWHPYEPALHFLYGHSATPIV